MTCHRVIDLFCGTGGFAQGFLNADESFKLAAAIDILPLASATTAANHPECVSITEDLRHVRPSKLKRALGSASVDLIIGGPPCQGFSSLRPFRSSTNDDPRNSLFEQFALYVNFFRPKCFVMENVVGLLTHEKGSTLERIETCFHDLGYETSWRILNAAHFGVPQKRERFVMIGAERGAKIRFPQPTHQFGGKTIGFRDKSRLAVSTEGLPRALSVMDAIGDLPPLLSGELATNYETPPKNPYQRARRRRSRKLTLHESANHSAKMLEVMSYAGSSIRNIPEHLVQTGFSSCYSRLDPDEPATTITVKFLSPASSKCIHPFQNRSITPREGARIQSFDDDYKFVGPKTNIATMIGNAVPPLLGTAIARAVKPLL